MKKRIFATVALLASMALVGCGKKPCEKHTWGKWEETTPATCTVDGEKTRKCEVCGTKETQPIAAGHKYGEWQTRTEATCAAKGLQFRTCSVCNHEDTRETDMVDHTWGEWVEKTAATCSAPGEDERECSVCHAKDTRETKAAHDWESQGNSAAVDGAAATEQFKCKLGDHYALRWAATDFNDAETIAACGLDAKDSTYYPEINSSGSHSGSIRLKKAEYVGQDSHVGTHVIYKVNLGAAATNIDLSFQIDPKSGYDVPVFDYVANDDQQGYRKLGDDDTLTLTTKRYGLRVNGVEVELGEDLHGDVNGGSKLWFNWNVKMNLNAGINTIDVYCLGGYRAYIYNLQLDGLTAAQLPAKAA